MSQIRVTLVFEQVSSSGDVIITRERHGAFVNDPRDIGRLANIASNTVYEQFPKFMEATK